MRYIGATYIHCTYSVCGRVKSLYCTADLVLLFRHRLFTEGKGGTEISLGGRSLVKNLAVGYDPERGRCPTRLDKMGSTPEHHWIT